MHTVNATVGAEITFRDLDASLVRRLRGALRYPNPDYLKARMNGGYVDPDIPRQLSAAEELPGGDVRVPRGAIDAIKPVFRACRTKVNWTDKRSRGTPLQLQIDDSVQLRDYQQEGVEQLRTHLQGLVVLPCAGGKSYLGIGAIAAVGASALVVVPTIDLVHQWAEDVEKWFGCKPSIFGARKHQLGPITIATKDALRYHDKLDLCGFGLAIFDEAHRMPAATCQALLRRVTARFRLGLTATPKREDGLTNIVQWSFGPTLLQRTVPELVADGWLVLPRVDAIFTNFDYDWPDDEDVGWGEYNKLTDALMWNTSRNKTIVDLVRREPDETWLILSPSRKAHCNRLVKMLKAAGVSSALAVTGDMSKGKRKKAMQALRDGSLKVMAATSLADEGLNIKRLSRVVFALPERSRARTEQRTGRSMRPLGAKKPIIYDLVDRNVDKLKSRWQARKRVYRSLGLEIRECPTLGLFSAMTA